MNYLLMRSQCYVNAFAFSFGILTVSFSANAYDIIHDISAIKTEAKDGDWIFFDIDGTILKATKMPVDLEDSNDNDEKIRIVELVDQHTPEIIKGLQKRGIPVFALTSRPYRKESEHHQYTTYKDLQDVGVTLSFFPDLPHYIRAVPDSLNNHHHSNSHKQSGFDLGTIFANHGEKGEALQFYLKTAQSKGYPLPNRILFTDDVEINLLSVEQYAPSFGVGEVKCFQFKPERKNFLFSFFKTAAPWY